MIFADDTSLFIIVDNPIDAACKLNSDLETIHHWATKWLVTFNPSKTEPLLLSRKHNRPQHSEITMNQQPITEVNFHKHLGITLNGECSWHEHLSKLKSKVWQQINIMHKLKFILDRQSLQAIYFSFIRGSCKKFCHWVRITSVLPFIKHIFITNLQSIPPLLKHIFVTFFTQSPKADK